MAAAKKGWTLHISAINEGNEKTLYGLLTLIAHAFQIVHPKDQVMSWSIDLPWKKWKTAHQRRVILATNRFFTGMEYLKQSNRPLLITDIDGFVSRPPQKAPPSQKIGLFFVDKNCDLDESNWKAAGRSLLAGIVHIPAGELGLEFLLSVQQNMRLMKIRWYLDQVALLKSYKEIVNPKLIYEFDESHMSWKHGGSLPLLWTAKGGLKDHDLIYLRKRKRLLKVFFNALIK